jgi:endonuclease/exonuclease/phosphatase family metal-dependent hydrolase
MRRNEECSFLKKRTKKLLFPGVRVFGGAWPKKTKVFCFFSSEKKTFLFLLFLVAPASATEIKLSTWNLNWLTTRSSADADLPSDVQVRAPEDFVRLLGYAQKLAADVVAFQEVDGQAAAAAIFDPRQYTIITIDENVVQRVGIAVRKSISVTRNPDVTALDVEPGEKFPLRDGLDVTLEFPGGARLRALVVHLKTGCQTDSLRRSQRPQCALLLRQIAPLAAWVAARRAEGMAFVVLGDFNRVFDEPEELGAALAGAAPLVRVTAGYENPCWNGAPFIDHIFLGGAARDWLRPESLRVQIFHEAGEGWRKRLSDHCPVSVKLQIPGH